MSVRTELEHRKVTGMPTGKAPEVMADADDADAEPAAIAVLPFTNESPNADDAWFAIGIHAEILDRLARIGSLRVVARPSVLRYAGGPEQVLAAGRELAVRTVLRGAVHYADDHIRVGCQLVDATSGEQLWAESYDRAFDDIGAIESDIAMQVAAALDADVSAEARREIERRPSQSTEAYAAYLEAISMLGTQTRPEPILALLNRAIELDPRFAMAYAQKAGIQVDALVHRIDDVALQPQARAEMEQMARRNAERALEIQPGLGIAHAALASIAVLTWRWREALEHTAHVDEVDRQRLLFLSVRYSWVLAWLGRVKKAVKAAQADAALNPHDWLVRFVLAVTYGYAGRYDKAIDSLHAAIELAPAMALPHIWLAVMRIATGDFDAAARELALAEELIGENRTLIYLPELALLYGRIGRGDDARRLFDETRQTAGNRDVGDGTWAMAYLAVDDQDKALEHLQAVADKAARHEIDQGFYNAVNLKMNVLRDPRLDAAPFKEILDRIGT